MEDKKLMIVLRFLIGLQVVYCGFKFIMILFSLIGNFNIVFSPMAILGFFVYGISIYLGMGFLRHQKYGWYGTAILYTILLLEEISLAILVNIIGKPYILNVSISLGIWPSILEISVYGILLKLIFSLNTLKHFGLNADSKIFLFLRVLIISLILTILYLVIAFTYSQAL